MSEYKIAVVNSSSFGQVFKEHWTALERLGEVKRFMVPTDIDGKTLAETLHGYNVIIASVTPMFNAEFFANKDELLLLSRHGIGFNNVDLNAAKAHGTKVTIVPQLVERNAVAENEFVNLLALVRQVVPAANSERNDHYEDRAQFMGNEFSGKAFGVVGCGNIGSRVAELFSVFGGPVYVADPNPKSSPEWFKNNNVERVDLDTLLAKCDYISLNASLDDNSYHMIDAAKFALLKPGAYICNNGRGALVDEDALLAAIDAGTLAGYAADAVEVEPVRASHPFLNNDRILLTPHTSAYTYECLRGMGEKCLSDVQNIINDAPLVRELTHTI
ncbi:D-isomer specific 2-hydroxyacid dehydrogenase family protein [Lactiplantibacillus fabifermentans]|uniref:2-hydroxyacid dehydrogenase n=2 Tax=Lactiplantibacillus fabifermentans TaxID=483011 RepID=A0A0R2NTZ0_9LACO|nr:D-isomer specific 2-hydroxyacid dehydrogenase family protein [Lactiplantibacillus fabifermentans]ETY73662.1 2-hydroxyacid dehydrogenase [Lactiplantibacillus fabifermentans T30PCM01]KRO29159.1 2-hydroxyacid dehydrogenase [Lactiplantibacillus fabifermentans DSM 21115]